MTLFIPHLKSISIVVSYDLTAEADLHPYKLVGQTDPH